MALVKNPLGGIAASGSVGGTTFARNRAGQYARAWAKPVNPATSRQTIVRNQFGLSSTTWGMLDGAAIAAWDAYAATVVRLNKLGEEYTPKGRQIYMETNQNLQQQEVGAMISTPGPSNESPAIINQPEIIISETAGVIDTLSFGDASALTGDFPGGVTANDNYFVLEASPPRDPKLTNVNNLFRQIAVGALNTQPVDALTGYTNVFGDAGLLDQLVDFRYWVTDKATGLISPQIKVTIPITAT